MDWVPNKLVVCAPAGNLSIDYRHRFALVRRRLGFVWKRTPYHVSGTMQDIGTAQGPSNSLSLRGIPLSDWHPVGGGETGFTASDPLWALTQRSTQSCCVSISRKPQCTTSWSSTTSTRSRSGLRWASVIVIRDDEAHLPGAGLAFAELDEAV